MTRYHYELSKSKHKAMAQKAKKSENSQISGISGISGIEPKGLSKGETSLSDIKKYLTETNKKYV